MFLPPSEKYERDGRQGEENRAARPDRSGRRIRALLKEKAELQKGCDVRTTVSRTGKMLSPAPLWLFLFCFVFCGFVCLFVCMPQQSVEDTDGGAHHTVQRRHPSRQVSCSWG